MLNHAYTEEFFRCAIKTSLAATCDRCICLSYCHREHCLSAITTHLFPPTTSQQGGFKKIIETSDSVFYLLGISVMFEFSASLTHYPQLTYASERAGNWRWEPINFLKSFILTTYSQETWCLIRWTSHYYSCICTLFWTWNISNSTRSNCSKFVLRF